MCPQLEEWPSEPLGEAGWPLCFGVLPGERCCSLPGARLSPDPAPGGREGVAGGCPGPQPCDWPCGGSNRDPTHPAWVGRRPRASGVRAPAPPPQGRRGGVTRPAWHRPGADMPASLAAVLGCPPWLLRGSHAWHLWAWRWGHEGAGWAMQGCRPEQPLPGEASTTHPPTACLRPARPAYSPHPAFSDGKFPRQQQHKL